MLDNKENYYAILGVPLDADSDTLKRAYRQLARRYHPDLAGPEGAVQMKRINRAYDVLSDPEKRLNYDTILGGVIDLRKGGLTRARPKQHRVEDLEFAGLSIFATKGPLHIGPILHTTLGVISALNSVQTEQSTHVAAGTLDGTGMLWHVGSEEEPVRFAADPTLTIESLRELRFSAKSRLLAGWGRLGLHLWDVHDGKLLWSYSLGQRAVSAHYSLDVVLQKIADGEETAMLALPALSQDPLVPRAYGVRGTDVVTYRMGEPTDRLSPALVCAENEAAKRSFWAIRLRSLAQDGHTLLTLSCAQTPGEQQEKIIIRRWDLTAHTRFGKKPRPRITTSVIAGNCGDCAPPYAVTPEINILAFVDAGHKVRLYDTASGTYSEFVSGAMGASSKLVISPNGRWLAVAHEDSEVNEGVIDLWSVDQGQLVQKLYHPWQISALHFAEQQLLVALTDGTIQLWNLF
jgi:WD40 repeat protein